MEGWVEGLGRLALARTAIAGGVVIRGVVLHVNLTRLHAALVTDENEPDRGEVGGQLANAGVKARVVALERHAAPVVRIRPRHESKGPLMAEWSR